MTFEEKISVLRDKYVAAFQSLIVEKNSEPETWFFLYALDSKINYLETAEPSAERDEVYHCVYEKLAIVYYNYAADNDYETVSFSEEDVIVLNVSIPSGQVYIDRIDQITANVVNTRHYAHFTVAFNHYIGQLGWHNDSSDWFLAYRLQQLLRHLENQNLKNELPDQAYVDCMYSYFPENGNYLGFEDVDSDEEIEVIVEDPTIVNPPIPGQQFVFTKIDGDNGEVVADTVATTLTFNGEGVDIYFDNETKTITFTVTASGVYDSALPDDTSMAEDVGGHSAGTLVSDLNGKTFSELWDILLFPPQPPTASLSGSDPKIVEVGTSIDPVLTGTFNQNGAGSLNSVSLKRGGSEIATQNPYTDSGLTSSVPASFQYRMDFDHQAGAQVLAGIIQSNNVNYQFVYPIFYGLSDDGVVNAAEIVAGNKVVTNDQTPTVTFNGTSSQRMWIAVPASYNDFTEWFVTVENSGAIGTVNDLFDAPSIIQVTTANWSNVNYKLYLANYNSAQADPMTFS